MTRNEHIDLVIAVVALFYLGCGGETNNGINCRFGTSEIFQQVCVNNKCTCRLDVSIQNLGTQSVSGALHYDAFNANGAKIGYADFQVPSLMPGASATLQNNILSADTGSPLTDCAMVSRVQSSTIPGCP